VRLAIQHGELRVKHDDRTQDVTGEARADRGQQQATRPAPGKMTRTSRLSPGREPAAQRKAAATGAGAMAPQARPLGDFTADPWMDAAHRGLTALAGNGLAHGGGQPMPGAVQAKMEDSFGADFSAVRIHTGDQAQALGARAFTQGTSIHFAAGEYDPGSQRGQELLGHELAHVVQQSQGRVQSTGQAKGMALNDDSSLEREADEMGARAARGEDAHARVTDATLPRQGGPGAVQGKGLDALSPAASQIIQRRPVDTSFGTFRDEAYTPVEYQGRSVGVEMHLSFQPNDQVEATKIGLTQAVKSYDRGNPEFLSDSDRGRTVKDGAAAGYRIDRVHGRNNPVYGTPMQSEGGLASTPESNAPQGEAPSVGSGADDNATYVTGYRKREGEAWQTRNAELWDKPKLPQRGDNAGQEFETTALALEGEQQGRYYGSVRWGWQVDGEGRFTRIELVEVSDADPSGNFTEAAALWNRYRFVPQIQPPDENGRTSNDARLVMEKNGKDFTIAAGNGLVVDRNSRPVGDTVLVTLDETIRLDDGGVYWLCWVPQASVQDGRITADTRAEIDGGSFTIAADSRVHDTGSVVGERVLIIPRAAILRNVAMAHRLVWAKIVDIRGGETIDLPVPRR
jgi:hypothetical protein